MNESSTRPDETSTAARPEVVRSEEPREREAWRDDWAAGSAALWPLPKELPRRCQRPCGSGTEMVALRALPPGLFWRAPAPRPALPTGLSD